MPLFYIIPFMTETREKTVCRLPELKERHLPGDCREAVYTLLKETYGYEQFRDLEVYDDLFKGKDTLQISQIGRASCRERV